MAELIGTVRGTRDFIGDDARRFERVLEEAANTFMRYGFEQVHLPLLEQTRLFARAVGADTDIVSKEMYTFATGTESLSLRPEGTAGSVRCYLQTGLHASGHVEKIWYTGPMFRHERPQKGRYRQFHQVGAEVFGTSDPLVDAELISMITAWFRELHIEEVRLRINSIGCPKDMCRGAYKDLLRESLYSRLSDMCDVCQRRFETNILRIFDCKIDSCRAVAETLPKTYEHLCDECAEHNAAVLESLDAAGCNATVDGSLVRGLDYYTKTVFEFTHPSLGSQDAIAGGGRYDGLIEQLGGRSTAAVGFAAGIERMMIALEASPAACSCRIPLMVYGIALDMASKKSLTGLLARLRDVGVSADMSFDSPMRSMKAQLRQANARNALVCLIIGDDELARGEVTVKDMRKDGVQKSVSLSDYVEYVIRLLM